MFYKIAPRFSIYYLFSSFGLGGRNVPFIFLCDLFFEANCLQLSTLPVLLSCLEVKKDDITVQFYHEEHIFEVL